MEPKPIIYITLPASAEIVSKETQNITIVVDALALRALVQPVLDLMTVPNPSDTTRAISSAIQSILALFAVPLMDKMIADGVLPGKRVDYEDPQAKADFLTYGLGWVFDNALITMEAYPYDALWEVQGEIVVLTGLVPATTELVEVGAGSGDTVSSGALGIKGAATDTQERYHSDIVTG